MTDHWDRVLQAGSRFFNGDATLDDYIILGLNEEGKIPGELFNPQYAIAPEYLTGCVMRKIFLQMQTSEDKAGDEESG